MFVRGKRNKSGEISVQVTEKRTGQYHLLQTLACSSDFDKVALLKMEAKNWMRLHSGAQDFDFNDYRSQTLAVVDGIDFLTHIGIKLLLGKLFNEIGINKISDDLFRLLVLIRIANPASKLKITDYLQKHHSIDIEVQVIYRYLDKLYKKQGAFK